MESDKGHFIDTIDLIEDIPIKKKFWQQPNIQYVNISETHDAVSVPDDGASFAS